MTKPLTDFEKAQLRWFKQEEARALAEIIRRRKMWEILKKGGRIRWNAPPAKPYRPPGWTLPPAPPETYPA